MTDIVYNKNGVPFDIDAIATDLNGKMDKDGVNAECPTLLSRTSNNQGGIIEIWSDGYCVQTGKLNNTSSGIEIFLTQDYKSKDDFCVFLQSKMGGYGSAANTGSAMNNSKNSFIHYHYNDTNQSWDYRTEGYIR